MVRAPNLDGAIADGLAVGVQQFAAQMGDRSDGGGDGIIDDDQIIVGVQRKFGRGEKALFHPRRLRLGAPDLAGKTRTTTARMSGIMTMPTGRMAGAASKRRRTKGMHGIAKGMSPIKTRASFHCFAFNQKEHPLITPQYPARNTNIPNISSFA